MEEPRGSLMVKEVEMRSWVGRAICTLVWLNWNLIMPQAEEPWEIYVVVICAVPTFKETEAGVQ